MKEEKSVEIPLYDWEGPIHKYLQVLSRKNPELLERLNALGFPSNGELRLSETPGSIYGPAYKKFTVHSVAVLLGNKNDLPPTERLGGVFHCSTGADNVCRLWRIWIMEIVHNGPNQDSRIRYIWNEPQHGGQVTIEGINKDLQRHTTGAVITKLKRLLPGLRIMHLEELKGGRPEGTGLFRNKEDFRIALFDVFAEFIDKPSETAVIERLRQHRLCQRKTSSASLQNQARTLRSWIKKLGYSDFHAAWRIYRLSRRSGK